MSDAPHSASPTGIVFVFSGHGAQWPGMARELLDTSPLFASHIDACERALEPHLRWSLTDVLRGKPRARRLRRVDVVQPALFAVTLSLAELWRDCGVTPQAVVGHSQGELAAACFAGALSLQDAALIIARRSRLLAEISGKGRMAAVACPRDWLQERIATQDLDLGAVNGPGSFAVGGSPGAIEDLLRICTAHGIKAGKVAIDYASHSRQIEPLRERLLTALDGIEPRAAEIPVFSTVTGERLQGGDCNGEHWYRAERGVVQFEQATRGLLAEGHATFLEIAPHPVLSAAIQQTVDAVCGRVARYWWRARCVATKHGPARMWSALTKCPHTVSRSMARVRANPWLPPSPARTSSSPLGSSARLRRARAHRAGRRSAEELSSVLGDGPLEPTLTRKSFKELGLDSTGVVELRNRLRSLTGEASNQPRRCSTAPAHRSGKFSSSRARRQKKTTALSRRSPRSRSARIEEPIAIVGMSCRFPGVSPRPRISGSCSQPEGRHCRLSPPIAAGTWTLCMTPIPTASGRPYALEAALPSRRCTVRRRLFRHQPTRGFGDGPAATSLVGSLLGSFRITCNRPELPAKAPTLAYTPGINIRPTTTPVCGSTQTGWRATT